MIQISSDQMNMFEKDVLSRTKEMIMSMLKQEFPAYLKGRDDEMIEHFVKQTMIAFRVIWIDEPLQLLRATRIAFILEYVRPEKERQRYFVRIMASEDSADARLEFAESLLL